MAGVYSRNRDCDKTNWKGEVALPSFESYIFFDDILDADPWEHYEEDIENFWPMFIIESMVE